MISNSSSLNLSPTPSFQVNSQDKKRSDNHPHLNFFNKEFAVGAGLFSDLANTFRLANAWAEWGVGHTTESSRKITDAGGVVKNLTGALEGPRNFNAAVEDWSKMRRTGTLASVMNFFASFCITAKSFYEGMELAALRFSLLPVKVLDGIKAFSPAGTLCYASRELIDKQIPALQSNWGTKEATSTMLRITKCVALVAVGFFSLLAIIYKPVLASGVYPVLLTLSLTCSVSHKFFDHLVLSEHSKKLQDKGVIV